MSSRKTPKGDAPRDPSPDDLDTPEVIDAALERGEKQHPEQKPRERG
jgi:hypothetical protein